MAAYYRYRYSKKSHSGLRFKVAPRACAEFIGIMMPTRGRASAKTGLEILERLDPASRIRSAVAASGATERMGELLSDRHPQCFQSNSPGCSLHSVDGRIRPRSESIFGYCLFDRHVARSGVQTGKWMPSNV